MIYCVVPEALADELFDKLTAYYADDPNVTVIVDRRKALAARARHRRAEAARDARPSPSRGSPASCPDLAGRVRPRPSCKLVVHVDGGARGNPGPAASVWSCPSADGEVLDELAERIGVATNNVAEYRALLRGLERARGARRERGRDRQRLRAGRQAADRRLQGQAPGDAAAARRGDRRAARLRRAGGSAACRGPRTPTPTRSSTRRSTRARLDSGASRSTLGEKVGEEVEKSSRVRRGPWNGAPRAPSGVLWRSSMPIPAATAGAFVNWISR